jgi:Protein of unknown function (DUF1566)/Secretion system C-terminal sorting domain
MKNKSFLPILLTVINCQIIFNCPAQSVLQTMKRLPDSGQKTSYSTTFGEDHDYTINAPYYINNGNGTTTDTITGLMWQKVDGGEMTVEAAATYCTALNLGGYTNWRLPTCHELFSILNLDKANPAHDTAYFGKSLAEYWWSSQRQYNDATKVWATNSGGGVGNHPKLETTSAGGTRKFHIRAVRDITTPATIAAHFINNGNGTTTDKLTNLIWQQIPFSDSLTWEQALVSAEALTLAGFSDWRLPNIKELQSISEETFGNPSISPTYFSGVTTGHYWSSTSLPNQTTRAWYLDNLFGITTYEPKTSRLRFVCVRGGNIISPTSDLITKPTPSINIFPNPSQGNLTINCETNGTFGNMGMAIQLITITNPLGQIIHQSTPNSPQAKINLSNKGLFFISIKANDQIYTRTVVIKD